MPKKKKVWKKSSIELVTDLTLIPKKISPAFGLIKNNKEDNPHYYFGLNRVCLAEYVNDDDDYITKKKETNLVLVLDNKTTIICDENILKDYNYELESTLLQDKPRWEIENIDDWLSDKTIPSIQALTTEELFNKIKKQFEEYLDLPKIEWYDYITLWIMGTYVYSFFDAYPMVYLYGLKNTGKTKIMTLGSLLAFNGEMFVGITPATLFRIIESDKPTLFLDEIEKLLDTKREGSSDIEAMLNSGYKRGATVPRCEKIKDIQQVKRYNVYCPKMFAHVDGKVSKTLISRCIRIIMERAKPKDKRSERWPEKHNKTWQKLRNELYIWALDNWNKSLFYYEGTEKIQKEIDIDNRAWELWQPILVLARMVSIELYDSMNKFALDINKETIKEEKEGREFILLGCLSKHINEDTYYFVSEIRSWLTEEYENIEETPSNKSIGWELRRLGLTDHKREGKGIKWHLNKLMINNLILKLGVETTQTSQTTLPKDNVVSVVSVVSTGGMDIIDNNNNNNNSGALPIYTNTLTTQTTSQNQSNQPNQSISSKIHQIIKYLSEKYAGGVVPMEAVVEMAFKASNLNEDQVEQAITNLLGDGTCFSPRNGFIKLL